ncbi:lipopolysaccharide kinase InaA family protein [Salinicola halophilus]|uniref:lipopolysaccharide kinase InaA family protein n=1 Tax=Salinicola halophilus TaxID=184065 RepID=UPI0013A6671F|nr:lipopolysaccharide kinase InaA family protein [Salinicola halophilus]
MDPTISPTYRPYFAHHGLTDFDALWALTLEPVDLPNRERGGHSEVTRLTLDAPGLPTRTFFLKRQTNHLGRSLRRPLGEPTFSREVRNIETFHRLDIPALTVAYHAERRRDHNWEAILATPELEDYTDLVSLNEQWEALSQPIRRSIVVSCAALLRRLHARRWRHGSLYAKHVFLRPDAAATHGFAACFIDLEKARPLINPRHERRRDVQRFARRLTQWGGEEWRLFLDEYLGRSGDGRRDARWQTILERESLQSAERS